MIVKGEAIAFNASGSKDPDGTIAKYEWDFDGNGTYETNGGSNPPISHTYATPGTYTVGLRVTDNGGKTATTTRPVSVNSGESSQYSNSVLATPGLAHYWRMGETVGPHLLRQRRLEPGDDRAANRPSASPAAIPNDPDRAAEFDGSNDAAKAADQPLGRPTR